MNHSRRRFLKKTAMATTGVALGSLGMTARSYSRIPGANDRVTFACIGLHGRGQAHLASIAANKNTGISHICDVDSRQFAPFAAEVKKQLGESPRQVKDFRTILASKDIDAITIAVPEHWTASIAVAGLQAGKHVYVEKPCSHNPAEGELLVRAQNKYGKLVQMGNQQRSSDHSKRIIQRIKEGLIGKVYLGKAWYSNTRGPIGVGKETPVPDYLDWDLWQGPAPRQPYKDNVHPYNWHWFWRWGTGETLNNGTHEVDLCRWALGVDFPNKVSAAGGRYHFHDDWEFYDTLVTSYEYDQKMIVWEGLSCQGKRPYGRGRGVTIHGTEGTVLLDREGYEVYDHDDKKTEEFSTRQATSTQDLLSRDSMTDEHFRNFLDGIRIGAPLDSPIEQGNISVTILQLSNIAWKTGRTLNLENQNGHIRDDSGAAALWTREYQPGWELKI